MIMSKKKESLKTQKIEMNNPKQSKKDKVDKEIKGKSSMMKEEKLKQSINSQFSFNQELKLDSKENRNSSKKKLKKISVSKTLNKANGVRKESSKEKNLLSYFDTDKKREKKPKRKNSRTGEKTGKSLKFPEMDVASSASSSQLNFLKSKTQKTKLTDLWGIKVKQKPAKERVIPDSRTPDERDLEIQRLKKKNSEIKSYLEMKKQEIMKNNEKLKDMENAKEEKEKKSSSIIKHLVIELAESKRIQTYHEIQDLKPALGENMVTSIGSSGERKTTFVEGYMIKNARKRLENFKEEKNKLETFKRRLKNCKKVQNSLHLLKNFDQEMDAFTDMLSKKQAIGGGYLLTENELREFKTRVQDLITQNSKAMDLAQAELNNLLERVLKYKQLCKRFHEERRSRYGRIDPESGKPKWPCIQERYQLMGFLGRGGFSEVYEAYDLIEHCYIACKVHQLKSSWGDEMKYQYIKHALRESEVHSKLDHPNILKQYCSCEIDNNSFCTILQKCSGPNLSQYLKVHKRLPEKEAKGIIRQILSGLKYLSKQEDKIIHYDLKPQNIIFHKGVPKISDFGLCKEMKTNHTKIELTSIGVGTYWYLPPECFQIGDETNKPKISTKVDIWSIGVIYFEMLYGQRPFGHGMSQDQILRREVILNAHNVDFPHRPSVSKGSKEFIKNCLKYFQDERYNVLEAFNAIYNL